MRTIQLLLALNLFILLHAQDTQTLSFGDTTLPPNSFNISELFTINYEFQPPGFITVAIRFNIPNQYFAIGFGTSMIGADIWTFELINNEVIAHDMFSLDHAPPLRDESIGGVDNLERLGYEITPAYTLVKVRRALDTTDSNDVVILQAPMDGMFATGLSPTMTYHGQLKGLGKFPFEPPRDVPDETENESVNNNLASDHKKVKRVKKLICKKMRKRN